MDLQSLYADRIISESEACVLLGVSADTLQRRSRRGEGPARLKLSPRRVGYRLADILSLIGKAAGGEQEEVPQRLSV
jgi:predicted DNA-binding transcriptional regulator AlpA